MKSTKGFLQSRLPVMAIALVLLSVCLVASMTLVRPPADVAARSDVNPAEADVGSAPDACTNIIVGKQATVDGSAITSYSSDGPSGANAKINVFPAKSYEPGTMTPIYYRQWQPETYAEYLASMEGDPQLLGYLPQVTRTNRYVGMNVWYDDMEQGGINEYGLTIGETTIGGREELVNPAGLMYAFDNPENSLMSLALARARTAREAIEVMSSLAEEYGYCQPYGENITINDGDEVWVFEIYGPGPNWTPGSDRPGAVWCAQRVPDGEVSVYANKSRIGVIEVDNPDYFLYSPNVFSLAKEMGWWTGDPEHPYADPANPFIFHQAYAPRGTSPNLREWAVLNWVAPSLHLDPTALNWPFSVVPDAGVSVQDVMAMHRDYYEGYTLPTVYDVTKDPKFNVGGRLSPLACPWNRDLLSLLGIRPLRSVGWANSVFTYVSQVRSDLPDPIKGCMWFCFGSAATGCYSPIYSGTTELPASWGHTSLTYVNRSDAYWAFLLADRLSYAGYQKAIMDIRGVRDPAEQTLFSMQPQLERKIADMSGKQPNADGLTQAERLATQYTNAAMMAVENGYWSLVDHLLFRYHYKGDLGELNQLPAIDLTSLKALLDSDAKSFPDVPTLHPYRLAIEQLAQRGIISGYTTGYFGPDDPVSRQQFAKMVTLTLGFDVSEGATPLPFTDVDRPSDSLFPDDYVAVAAANGLIQGYGGGLFGPYDNISRAQLLTIVVRAAERFKPQMVSTPPASWNGVLPSSDSTHGENIRRAEYSGLVSGIDLTTFSIWQSATRGEVAQVLWRLIRQ